jgi:thymidine kinase
MFSPSKVTEKPYDGSITLIIGPMFAGKTTTLNNKMKEAKANNLKCLVINSAKDERYNNVVRTHYRQEFTTKKCSSLMEVEESIKQYDVIAIDEGQFFDDIADKAEEFANSGKKVIIAALKSDFRREPFQNVADLIAKADELIPLLARCDLCDSKTAFTQRMCTNGKIVLVGGKEKYRSLCRTCYFKQKDKGKNFFTDEPAEKYVCARGKNGNEKDIHNKQDPKNEKNQLLNI